MALGRSVEELKATVSHKELVEWRAFDIIDPIGGRRLDTNVAHLLCYIGHMMGVYKNKELFISDLMLNFDEGILTAEERKVRHEEVNKLRSEQKRKNFDIELVSNQIKNAFSKIGK